MLRTKHVNQEIFDCKSFTNFKNAANFSRLLIISSIKGYIMLAKHKLRRLMVSVRIENLTKSYRGKKVINDVTLEFKDKTFTTILGPPGAGKTTLLKLIAGIIKPDVGRIYFNDEDVTDLPAKDRNVAMIFQSFALYPNKKVYDNIATPLVLKKLPADEIRRRIKEVTEMLGISELLDRFPAQLSGGEQQRVAIARALVKEANVYLFDEPLTNLDYKIRETMRAELKTIFAERGGTVIYATPDPLDTLTMSQYVAMLNEGKVHQYGEVMDVYYNPADAFVGRYFSFPPMNMIPADVVQSNGRLFLKFLDQSLDVTKLADLIGSEKTVIVGVRPGDFSLETEKPESELVITGEVIITEVIGSETIVHLKCNDQRVSAFIAKIFRVMPGEKLSMGAKFDDIYLFRDSDKKFIGRLGRLLREGVKPQA